MTIIVEDGSIVAGANSFVTIAFVRAYAAERGVDLPVSDSDLAPMMVKAFDCCNAKEDELSGSRVSRTQTGCYPRTDVTIYGFDVAEDEIPIELQNASAQLVCEQGEGVDIMPTTNEPPKTLEKIGQLTTQWDVNGWAPGPSLPKVDAALRPLLKRSGVGLRTYRA